MEMHIRIEGGGGWLNEDEDDGRGTRPETTATEWTGRRLGWFGLVVQCSARLDGDDQMPACRPPAQREP